jgi:ABC-type transport system involved in cytochrome c biogenesis permease subunit
MAALSSTLFSIGVIFVALGFAAHVGHAVMLANGRRLPSLAAARVAAPQPAYAGVVTGSFVDERERAASIGLDTYAAPAPVACRRRPHLRRFLVLATSMLLRAYLVGRGPWGNMFEFSVAFSTSMLGGYLFLQRPTPSARSGSSRPGSHSRSALREQPAARISTLVPALQNPPLLTIHVGLAVISYSIFATSFAASVAYLAQGQDDQFSWLPSHKVLDEVAYRAVIIGFPIFAR